MKKLICSTVIMLSTSVAIQAAAKQAELDKFSMTSNSSVSVTAEVQAIDYDTRVVTLAGGVDEKEGEYTFTAGEEVRNLAQVEVGDMVTAEFLHTISVQVLNAEGVEPGVAQLEALARAKEGEKPGVESVQRITQILKVADINLETNSFKLEDDEGVITEYKARDPQNLQKAAVGDVVVITDTQALALSVTEVPDEK